MLAIKIIIAVLCFATTGAAAIIGALHIAAIGTGRADAITRGDD